MDGASHVISDDAPEAAADGVLDGPTGPPEPRIPVTAPSGFRQARCMTTVQIVLAAITSFMLLVAALSKVTGSQSMRDMAEHLSIAWPRYRAIGFVELAAIAGIVLGLWWTWIGVAAGAGTAALLVGAVVVHRRAGDGVGEMGPALATLAAAAGYVVVAVAA